MHVGGKKQTVLQEKGCCGVKWTGDLGSLNLQLCLHPEMQSWESNPIMQWKDPMSGRGVEIGSWNEVPSVQVGIIPNSEFPEKIEFALDQSS